jgi:hypothetical protein
MIKNFPGLISELQNQGQRQTVDGLIDSMIDRRKNEIERLTALKKALEPKDMPQDVEEFLWQMLISYETRR